MESQKILALEDLRDRLSQLRSVAPGAHRPVVVHCHGVFDLLHYGHLKHLESAKKLGDILVVTLTPDHFVNKGPDRPVFSDRQRAEFIAALGFVDFVAINRWPTAIETLRLLKPDLYVKGAEYRNEADDITAKIGEEAEAVREGGGQIAYTDDIVFSSSHLLNHKVGTLKPAVKEYLVDFLSKFSFHDVVEALDKASKLKVLVVGETIIDEYHYCQAIGKSSKEPTLVASLENLERFAGGTLAVANHLSGFCENVDLLTMLGSHRPETDFIESHLAPQVGRHYFYRSDGPTIIKRRFVEKYFLQKLFEVYEMTDAELSQEDDDRLCQQMESLLPNYDLVLVVDYGHGFLSSRAIAQLTRLSKYLAVNAQCNAGNLGYHTISRYPQAHFFCMTERELRLEARLRSGEISELVAEVLPRLNCEVLCTTRGVQGSFFYKKSGHQAATPSLATKVVDRVGAGDAFLSLAALVLAAGAPIEVAGLLGNAAGAQAVATMCNRDAVERVALLRHLQTLLK